MTLSNRFAKAMADLLPLLPLQIGVAVSGGGDSMALLTLAAAWGQAEGCQVHAVTVDHGLRPEAADEAEMVARRAKELGLSHTILPWRDWDGRGNLQDAARQARRQLMARWAKDLGVRHLCLGHTLDDQAETVLMRLARGSGVDGLAGMAPAVETHDRLWLRPLLQEKRQDLREHLAAEGLTWVDDPSNEDDRFDRIKAREALALLQPLGLTAERLGQTADHMLSARWALRMACHDLAQRAAQQKAGDIVLRLDIWLAAPRELQTRLLSGALGWVSGQKYKPRFRALNDCVEQVRRGQSCTLQGCQMLVQRDELQICREWNAVKDHRSDLPGIWDHRWQVGSALANPAAGVTVAALGEAGLQSLTDWRDSGFPRASLLSSPAIWRDGRLLAAPLAEISLEWSLKLISGRDDFNQWLLSH